MGKRYATPEEREAHQEALRALPITEEEKVRWAPMITQTWGAIADDADQLGRVTQSIAYELVFDANRIQTFGGMTDEEDAVVSAHYHDRKFERWAKSVLKPYI